MPGYCEMKSLIMFFIICLAIQAQTVKIVKVLDSNLFQLDDGRIIKLAGIDVPNLSNPTQFFQAAAKDAVDYAKVNLLDRLVEIYSISRIPEKNFETVTMYKNYLFNRVNINAKYLSLGFGKYLNNIDEDLNKELLDSEMEAIKNGIGIWYYGNWLTNKDTLDADLIKSTENIYSDLYMNLEYKIKRPTP